MTDAYSYESFGFLSQLIRDLIAEKTALHPFVHQFFDVNAIERQIAASTFSTAGRERLVTALRQQYQGVSLSEATEQNMRALRDDTTYTVTTGHQLNLLSGPLYTLYKIAHVIAFSRQFQQRFPSHRFVPVFWMATEDHDFEEINHIHLFDKKVQWEKESQKNHIVGRISTCGMDAFLREVEEQFDDPKAKRAVQQLTSIYRNSPNLSVATRTLVNRLFGSCGLVVIDGDDPLLKTAFAPIARREINEGIVFRQVTATNRQLTALHYHQQAHVRPCNLFYIHPSGKRSRIERRGQQWRIDSQAHTAQTLLDDLEKYPERFSPNALMRPLYQETVLPNLVYIGGGAELAYWMQLKATFEQLELPYPLLRLRDAVLLVKPDEWNTLKAAKVQLTALKSGIEERIKALTVQASGGGLDVSDVHAKIDDAKQLLLAKTQAIGKGMDGMVEAAFVKFSNQVERIEQKMIKAEKSKFEHLQHRLQKMAQRYFPQNGFQERHDNFLPYLVRSPSFVEDCTAYFSPDAPPAVRVVQLQDS